MIAEQEAVIAKFRREAALLRLRAIAAAVLTQSSSYMDAYRFLTEADETEHVKNLRAEDVATCFKPVSVEDEPAIRTAWQSVLRTMRADRSGDKFKFARDAYQEHKEVKYLHAIGVVIMSAAAQTLEGVKVWDGKMVLGMHKKPDWTWTGGGVNDVTTLTLLGMEEEKRRKYARKGTAQMATYLGRRTSDILNLQPDGTHGISFGIVSTVSHVKVISVAFRPDHVGDGDKPVIVRESKWVSLLPSAVLSRTIAPTRGFKLLWRFLRTEHRSLGYLPPCHPILDPETFEGEGNGEGMAGGPDFELEVHPVGLGSTSTVYGTSNGNEVVKIAREPQEWESFGHESTALADIHATSHAGATHIPKVVAKGLLRRNVTHLRMRPRGSPLVVQLWALKEASALPFAWVVLEHVLLALQAAHSAGYVHMDVRASNIVWVTDDSKALLVDWGMAMKQGVDRIFNKGGDCFCRSAYELRCVDRGKPCAWMPHSDIIAALYVFASLAARRVTPAWTTLSVVSADAVIESRQRYLDSLGGVGTFVTDRVQELETALLRDQTKVGVSLDDCYYRLPRNNASLTIPEEDSLDSLRPHHLHEEGEREEEDGEQGGDEEEGQEDEVGEVFEEEDCASVMDEDFPN